ncbi:MAG TPA: hypothetical protein VFP10_08980 [Candidatus Eisenbacteria bacterium]|nr:hypothetical protein [Candidatus Eisenbacteria bacterium]
MRRGWLLLIVAVLLAGCGQRGERKSETASSDTTLTPAPHDGSVDSSATSLDSVLAPPRSAEWTAGIVDLPALDDSIATLVSVRHAAHGNFDRLVFEWSSAGRPGAHVEYIDRPVRSCGSGEVVPLAGDAWLLIKFTPAVAHTEEGHPTVGDRSRTPNLPTLKELELICDFEADVSWVAGVSSPQRYRAFVLTDPPRVIVDIGH